MSGFTEKFNLSLAHADGHIDRVVVQIGLDGLKISNSSDNRVIKSYELSHISRWQSRGTSLVLYTRTPSDVEEKQVSLQGGETLVRTALDTLTSCCLQLAELLQSKQTDVAQETANNLHALVSGNGKKKSTLPAADDVEYWKSPEKEGWLSCQGDHLKQWRRRWFVLKQGYLHRFYNDKVSASIKPRGVIDLSKVQDVKPVPGKGNMLQIKTSNGAAVQYVAGSETEVVEWISALEGTMLRLSKAAAGIEDPPPPKPAQRVSNSGASTTSEWLKQLERNFASVSVSGSKGGSTSSGNAATSSPTMVSVVGYDAVGKDSYGGHTERDRDKDRDYVTSSSSPYAALSRKMGTDYSSIAGAQPLSSAPTPSNDLDLNYGGYAGRSAAPASHAPPAASYSQQQQQQQHGAYQHPSTPYPSQSASLSPTQSYSAQQPVAYHTTQGQYAGMQASMGTVAAMPSGGYAGVYGQPQMQPQPQPQMQLLQQQQQQQHPTQQSLQQPLQQQQQPYGMYGQAQQPQPQLQVPQQQGMAVSLMDQVPHQQPAYPYYQQASAPQAQAAAPAAVPVWQVHYTADARPYYYNAATGVTQWEAPMGMA